MTFSGNFRNSVDGVESLLFETKDNMECGTHMPFGIKMKHIDAMEILRGGPGSARERNFLRFYNDNARPVRPENPDLFWLSGHSL